jgi:hypothetical protein
MTHHWGPDVWEEDGYECRQCEETYGTLDEIRTSVNLMFVETSVRDSKSMPRIRAQLYKIAELLEMDVPPKVERKSYARSISERVHNLCRRLLRF